MKTAQQVKAGIIGRVVDDADANMNFDVLYEDKRIGLGQEVPLDDVREKPTIAMICKRSDYD